MRSSENIQVQIIPICGVGSPVHRAGRMSQSIVPGVVENYTKLYIPASGFEPETCGLRRYSMPWIPSTVRRSTS